MLECTSVDFDHRIGCFAVNCRADYRWYLENTHGSEELLSIQRKIITGRKTYQTLRADLTRGCLLPPIVLAVSEIVVPDEMNVHPENVIFSLSEEKKVQLADAIVARSNAGIRIVDGLQRTNALRDVSESLAGQELEDFLARPVRLEFWINISFYALAYRMLLLNAGQKPMSMKHQLEIVAENMQTELQTIDGLEVITSMENRRRSAPGQFQLSALAGAFQAWLQRQPHIDLRNAVTEQLLADEAIEALGRGMSLDGSPRGEEFTEFVRWLVTLDNKLGPTNLVFLGVETVLLGLAAAVSSGFYSESLKDRTQSAMKKLIEDIDRKGLDEGLGQNLFSDMRNAFDVKKVNVGKATRDFVNYAFSEYFRNEGEKTMPECWIQASAQVSSS